MLYHFRAMTLHDAVLENKCNGTLLEATLYQVQPVQTLNDTVSA